jgi:hypothetical protein
VWKENSIFRRWRGWRRGIFEVAFFSICGKALADQEDKRSCGHDGTGHMVPSPDTLRLQRNTCKFACSVFKAGRIRRQQGIERHNPFVEWNGFVDVHEEQSQCGGMLIAFETSVEDSFDAKLLSKKCQARGECAFLGLHYSEVNKECTLCNITHAIEAVCSVYGL